jgi:hypothetical protein
MDRAFNVFSREGSNPVAVDGIGLGIFSEGGSCVREGTDLKV